MFNITEGNIASVLDYASQLFDDVKLLFFLIAGLCLGTWIIEKIVSLFRDSRKHWYTEGGFEEDPTLTEEDKEYYRGKL